MATGSLSLDFATEFNQALRCFLLGLGFDLRNLISIIWKI
jgi:hypothetical protein